MSKNIPFDAMLSYTQFRYIVEVCAILLQCWGIANFDSVTEKNHNLNIVNLLPLPKRPEVDATTLLSSTQSIDNTLLKYILFHYTADTLQM